MTILTNSSTACIAALPLHGAVHQNDRSINKMKECKILLSWSSTGVVVMVTDRRFLPHQPVPGRHSNAVLGDEETRDVEDASRAEALPDVQ